MFRKATLGVLAIAAAAALAGGAGAGVTAGNVTLIVPNHGPVTFAGARWERQAANSFDGNAMPCDLQTLTAASCSPVQPEIDAAAVAAFTHALNASVTWGTPLALQPSIAA